MNGDLRSVDEGSYRRADPRIGQDRGMDAAGQRTKLDDRLLRLGPRLLEQPRPFGPVTGGDLLLSQTQQQRERYQPLLRTVM